MFIKNVRIVRPHGNKVHESDIAIKGERVVKVEPGIDATRAKVVCDGRSRLAFPGVVAAHMRSVICSPLPQKRRHREQGRGHRRRHQQPELLSHRPVLPELGRALRQVFP